MVFAWLFRPEIAQVYRYRHPKPFVLAPRNGDGKRIKQDALLQMRETP
jgi:hypothetical protein